MVHAKRVSQKTYYFLIFILLRNSASRLCLSIAQSSCNYIDKKDIDYGTEQKGES